MLRLSVKQLMSALRQSSLSPVIPKLATADEALPFAKRRTMGAKSLLTVAVVAIAMPLACRAEYQLNNTSKNLAFCGAVFAYAANLFLLQNNEGAAKVMVFQGSRATVGLLSMHYDNGRVPGDRAAAFKAEGVRAIPYLDANPSKLSGTIDSCVAATNAVVNQQSSRGVKMWGKTFNELVDETSASSRSALGIR